MVGQPGIGEGAGRLEVRLCMRHKRVIVSRTQSSTASRREKISLQCTQSQCISSGLVKFGSWLSWYNSVEIGAQVLNQFDSWL